MIHSTVDLYAPVVGNYVSASGVPMLAVEYRRAPEHPHPTSVEDSYTGLQSLADHSAELGVDPARIAVMGDSAGGGIAAGVALLARDRGGPALARQILVYPMLDDRTAVKAPDPSTTPFLVWSNDDNITGWGALLGERVGGADVPVYAAPARVADPAGLPPTYIEVGTLDLFRDEDIEYARRTPRPCRPSSTYTPEYPTHSKRLPLLPTCPCGLPGLVGPGRAWTGRRYECIPCAWLHLPGNPPLRRCQSHNPRMVTAPHPARKRNAFSKSGSLPLT
jgi:hypothetical protein